MKYFYMHLYKAQKKNKGRNLFIPNIDIETTVVVLLTLSSTHFFRI